MTKKEMQIAAGVGILGMLVWWGTRSKAKTQPTVVTPTGDVLLGVPTVTGASAIQGGTDYGIRPPDLVDVVSSP